ncbi:MAG: tRNA pseudouridine(13) synthase TruD [Pseudomonadota bacterium]
MSDPDREPARAHGMSLGRARIRVQPEDFFVDEELPFVPDGSGEHLLVQVEKRGHNTAWVGQRLSQFAGIHPRLVSFSGRKDRHAVTRQWFSLQLTARPDPDWTAFREEGIRVLASHRHGRKLRTGTHRINHFALLLRDVAAEPAAVDARLALIARAGVPDYFGEQRFGRATGADGWPAAVRDALQTGRLPSRPEKRGLVISVLRSAIFNAVLDARVRDGTWNHVLPGEPAMLDGTGGRWFVADDDPALDARCAALDVHPGGLLAGTGGTPPSGQVAELEARIAGSYDGVPAALARWRVESGRRPLRSRVLDLQHAWLQPGVLRLTFGLWRGSYATAVLRELFEVENAAAVISATDEADPD